MGLNEVLYQQNDAANDIYFIETGNVKLYCDLNDHIIDDALLSFILQKRYVVEDQDGIINSTNIKAIIKYTAGGYFGDHDIFSQMSGISSRGRDLSAYGDTDECTLFRLSK